MGNRFYRDRRERSRRSDLVSTDRRRGRSERDAFLESLFASSTGHRSKPDHKTQMLCRQVQRTLMFALGELEGVDLSDISIGDVHPAPNAGHLVVEMIIAPAASEPAAKLVARLAAHTPRLRHLIAQGISRKRVPELSFVPVAGGAP